MDRINLSEIKPNPDNPRQISAAQLSKLVESIKRDPAFMTLRPIVVDENGVILGGNMRYRACLEAGMKDIPASWVIKAADLTPEQARRFILVDNAPTGMSGEWDYDSLSNLWDTDDLLDIGFTPGELGMGFELPGEPPEEDELPPPPAEPITKHGDLILLGDHRLLCGDSTKEADVKRLMGGNKADVLVTDPPYGVNYTGGTKNKLTIKNDDGKNENFAPNIVAAFNNMFDVACRQGAYSYATVPAGPLHLIFANHWSERGVLRQIMVWVKDSLVLGHSEYHYRHEPILFGWIPGGQRHKNPDRTRDSVFEIPRPKRSEEHPTMKPIELFSCFISDSTKKNDIVVDPFGVSGTTLIASEQLSRKCYMMELDPGYCDVIVQRWESITGKKAVRPLSEAT